MRLPGEASEMLLLLLLLVGTGSGKGNLEISNVWTGYATR